MLVVAVELTVLVKVSRRCRLDLLVKDAHIEQTRRTYMCANHLPEQLACRNNLQGIGEPTTVSVMSGIGVQDLGSDRFGSDENALMPHQMALRVGARSNLCTEQQSSTE